MTKKIIFEYINWEKEFFGENFNFEKEFFETEIRKKLKNPTYIYFLKNKVMNRYFKNWISVIINMLLEDNKKVILQIEKNEIY